MSEGVEEMSLKTRIIAPTRMKKKTEQKSITKLNGSIA